MKRPIVTNISEGDTHITKLKHKSSEIVCVPGGVCVRVCVYAGGFLISSRPILRRIKAAAVGPWS